jgi:hypothetical protein
LAKIWEELLEVTSVSVSDNFFALGGHSLLLIKLVAKINGLFTTDISLAQMFELDSLSSLAQLIDSNLIDSEERDNAHVKPVNQHQETVSDSDRDTIEI